MLTKLLTALLLFATLHGSAHASIITVTVHGIIMTDAIDRSAMFGPIGRSLFGMNFTTTVRYARPDKTDFSDPHWDRYNSQVDGAVPVSFAITIDNRTLVREFVPIEMSHIVADQRGTGFADFSTMSLTTGNVESGVGFTYSIFNFHDGYVPTRPRLEAPFVYEVADADGAYGAVWLRPGSRSHGNLDFNAEFTRLEVSSDWVDVPEPAAMLLVLGALGAAGLARRRGRFAENVQNSQ